MSNICPACEAGQLVSRVGDKYIQFDGERLKVSNLQYSECPECGETVVLAAQAKRNEVAYADAKKAKLGLWSCGKIEAFRKEWNLTQAVASSVFGGGPNAFSKYERGEVVHSKAMDLLMRVFSQSEEARQILAASADVRLEGQHAWVTIQVAPAPAPRSRALASSSILKFERLAHAVQAQPEVWETCEVANGH